MSDQLKPVMNLVFSEKVKLAMKVTESWLAYNCLKLFECFLYKGKTKNSILDNLELERERE